MAGATPVRVCRENRHVIAIGSTLQLKLLGGLRAFIQALIRLVVDAQSHPVDLRDFLLEMDDQATACVIAGRVTDNADVALLQYLGPMALPHDIAA